MTNPSQQLVRRHGDHIRLVSLKTVAAMVDAHRTTVRRWLHEDGIQPLAVGRGRNGSIRYRWAEIEAWLTSRPVVD